MHHDTPTRQASATIASASASTPPPSAKAMSANGSGCVMTLPAAPITVVAYILIKAIYVDDPPRNRSR